MTTHTASRYATPAAGASPNPSGEGDALIGLQELGTRLVETPHCAASFISAGKICAANVKGTDGPCFGDKRRARLATCHRPPLAGHRQRQPQHHRVTLSASLTVYTTPTYHGPGSAP